jgi:AcrR family transcriptional regulator
MSTHDRKNRERAERESLIITTARDLAETEGWDAVTMRRIASQVEYSQPVLYSHFSGKNAIMAAVAAAGFAELADELQAVRTAATEPRQALADVAAAYADFAQQRPAQYEAMFTNTVDPPFASPESPVPCATRLPSFARPPPRPSAAACSLNRAVAMTRPSCSAVM